MNTPDSAIPAGLPEELRKNLRDPMWRLEHLYKIVIKGDEGEDDLVVRFKPNRAQKRFIARLWHRNIILKARQLGFTTLICILWLDHALFNANQRCGIVAQDLEAAEAIFRDKVKFAYENLPDALREAMPLKRDSSKELLFAHNNSAVRVATSMRSGTINRLLVSEFGKICAKFPDRAHEVVTGSIPAVPKNGITVIESTAEGREGEFYDMTQQAIALYQQRKELTMRDFRFHFFPWWQEPNYRMDPANVLISDEDSTYFDAIQTEANTTITAEQRAWYVATRDTDFAGKTVKMWQEYPSSANEAFQVSMDGAIFVKEMMKLRAEGRIRKGLPVLADVPVNTFWDLGWNDANAVWCHQYAALENRFIKSHQESGWTLQQWCAYLQAWQAEKGVVFGTHYLPHDADNKSLQTGKSIVELLREIWKGQRFVVVPRTENKVVCINQAKTALANCYFDADECADGIEALDAYRWAWSRSQQVFTDAPHHGPESNYSDAFQQFGQGYAPKQQRIRTPDGDSADTRRRPRRKGGSWRSA